MENETQTLKAKYWQYIVGFFGLLFVGGAIGATAFLFTENLNASPAPEHFADLTEPQKDLKIKGNKNSKIYHLPGCASYDRIAEKNIIWFKTKEEAEAAGFRMAKNC